MTPHKLTDPEIEALFAEKVLGKVPCEHWESINFGSGGGPAVMKRCKHERCYPVPWPPLKALTSIAAAFAGLEAHTEWDWSIASNGMEDHTYECCIFPIGQQLVLAAPENNDLARAIVYACLLAVGAAKREELT